MKGAASRGKGSGVPKKSEAGAETKALCRCNGITPTTLYRWKAKYIRNGGRTLLLISRYTIFTKALLQVFDSNLQRVKSGVTGIPVNPGMLLFELAPLPSPSGTEVT